jgi:hypothetical protein
MSNKTISINPSLFSVSGSKTKKNREKISKPKLVPIISPNVLKNKLLKRIKEHKQKENIKLAVDKNKINNELINNEKTSNKNEILNFSDEFTDSINYLQTLSKQKTIDNEKRFADFEKQTRKEELERKTLKNYHSLSQQPIINIDLPDELNEPVLQIPKTEPFTINPYKKNDIPYGILKGGTKPTYREWSKTIKNNIVTDPNSSLIIQGPTISSEKTARENRLNLLKQKIKNQELLQTQSSTENVNIITKPPEQQSATVDTPIQINNSTENPDSKNPISESNIIGGKLIATKHITKKTIKRKYTLGKSQIKKTVGVLIKDRGTRKRILAAQKDLKRKNINDIKIYLKEHNLIKTGSNAPNDVLRKLYESAMLTGEITNSNVDTLLYNFSKDDKKL